MNNRQKIIGTLLPVSALYSMKQKKADQGTFIIGLDFLDWLKTTHQSAWQMLPLHETQLEKTGFVKHVPSPYKSYGIGLNPKYLSSTYLNLLPTKQELDMFVKKNHYWIKNYALFCALRDHFQTDDWRQWDQDLTSREADALAYWSDKLKQEINKHITMQWQLYQSYTFLKKKAKKLGVALMGDLPFYLSIQSPLVWAHQNLFQIEKDGYMQYVSGMPDGPSAFFGRQIWGHPLYKWEGGNQQRKVILFWKMRLRYLASLFDSIRIDYTKGFVEYGVVDRNNKRNDGFREGPGYDFIKELVDFCKRCGLWVYAEDNGQNIENLRNFLKILKIPGIKIFRFALNEKKGKINKEYSDISHYPQNSVAYTTTHDTETLLGYLHNLTSEQKQRLAIATNVAYYPDDKIFAKTLRDAILTSPAQTVIVPIQDWLLTTDRINIPGTELPVNDPNWNFRLKVPIEKLPTNFPTD